MKSQVLNERGNSVYRDGEADTFLEGSSEDRYGYDFNLCSAEKGWKQFYTDQDAWYFGVWVHLGKRMIFTYCEGDRILTVCPTIDSFRAELADAEGFYGAPPPAFTIINDGKITEVFDTRPAV